MNKLKLNICILIGLIIVFDILFLGFCRYNNYKEIEVAVVKEDLKPKKYIAITFDDGPSVYTNKILDILKENDSKATFFMIGSLMKIRKQIVLNVYNAGMEVGTHGYRHNSFVDLSNSKIKKQFNSSTILYNEITGSNISLFRPPYGEYNKTIRKLSPYPIVLWSVDPKDWQSRDADKVYKHVIRKSYDGCIVIMHDLYPSTVEALKKIIPYMKKKGYEFVTVSELARIKNRDLNKGEVIREIKG